MQNADSAWIATRSLDDVSLLANRVGSLALRVFVSPRLVDPFSQIGRIPLCAATDTTRERVNPSP